MLPLRPLLLLVCVLALSLAAPFARAQAAPATSELHPVVGVGDWIWSATTTDRQECRFVREFEVPAGARVTSAVLRITADNSYHVFLDGAPIGQGGDWRVLIEYELARLLAPGRHVLAVHAVNDFDIAGLLAGLRIRLDDGREIGVPTDPTWRIAPADAKGWPAFPPRRLSPAGPAAPIVKTFDTNSRPQTYRAPPSLPLPVSLWEKRWFQISLIVLALAGLVAGLVLGALLLLKTQAERIVRRERARIAADLHDNLGGGLTQLIYLGEAARRGSPSGPGNDAPLARLCDQARELARGMNETVWLINSSRDTVRDLAHYLVRHAETFFRDTPVRCRFAIDDDLPPAPCDLGVRRNLFLAVKEALTNVLRHSGASEVELRVEWRREVLRVVVRDDGRGFDLATARGGEGLGNFPRRIREAGGRMTLRSRVGAGTTLEFIVPLAARSRLGRAHGRRTEPGEA